MTTLAELNGMTDAQLKHLIACEMGSCSSLRPNSKTSMRIAMAQQVLRQRGRAQVGRNGCTGGSKTRCKKEK